MVCTMNSPENRCGDLAKHYYTCRRERDAQLFSAIKSWETETFSSLKPEARSKYLGELEAKQARFQQMDSDTP